MVRPVSIRHSKILAAAYAALGEDQREELRRSHSARINQRARQIIERRQEQDRLARRAQLSAHRAALFAARAFEQICASEPSDIDRQRWREARAVVEDELRKIVDRARR